jgi:hypothetical protein
VPTPVPKQVKINILHSANLTNSLLVHEFSTRVGGSSRAYGGQALNPGFTPDPSKAANRAAFSRELTAAN